MKLLTLGAAILLPISMFLKVTHLLHGPHLFLYIVIPLIGIILLHYLLKIRTSWYVGVPIALLIYLIGLFVKFNEWPISNTVWVYSSIPLILFPGLLLRSGINLRQERRSLSNIVFLIVFIICFAIIGSVILYNSALQPLLISLSSLALMVVLLFTLRMKGLKDSLSDELFSIQILLYLTPFFVIAGIVSYFL